MSDSYTLIILSEPPYAGSAARSALDLALAYAVFGQAPRVLFQGAGVLQLAPGQAPRGRKSLGKVIDSMPLYDIEKLYVAGEDLAAAGLDASELPGHAECIDAAQLLALRGDARHIVSL